MNLHSDVVCMMTRVAEVEKRKKRLAFSRRL